MKKKIAIIGTSPVMLIIAHNLNKKRYKVTIFNPYKKIGGAWAYYKFNNNFISTQTNVIVPDTQFEERNIPLINEYLKKEFKIEIKINRNKFKPLGYLAKKNYDYNFNPLYEMITNNSNIKINDTFVKRVSLKKNKVIINNKVFDELYIPTYSGIQSIKENDNIIYIKPRIIISEHVMIIAKKINSKYLSYSENCDQNFDRAQIRKIEQFMVFTARIRKNKKGKNVLKLILNSKLVNKKSDIIKIVKTKYKNYYRNFEQRDFLSRNTKETPINYINTALFVESFFQINDKLGLLKKKYY